MSDCYPTDVTLGYIELRNNGYATNIMRFKTHHVCGWRDRDRRILHSAAVRFRHSAGLTGNCFKSLIGLNANYVRGWKVQDPERVDLTNRRRDYN